MQKTLVVITGPTGIGKTKAAIEVAGFYNTEIISADSRQLFKELKIGTAVPDTWELEKVRHHFIQTNSIFNPYNASQYETDVLKLLKQLFIEYNIVVLTGGSMLYIDAVCNGIDDLPDVDLELRKSLMERLKTEGLENMRFLLKKLDPDYYAVADLKNPKRILHALEICLMTGKPYSSFRSNTIKERPFKIIKIGLNCHRETLYNRINQRVEKMIGNGLVEEARSVYGFKNLNALNTVGYKELFDYFDGKTGLEKAIELIKNSTRKYARKQLTWFRKDKNLQWFEPEQMEKIIQFINSEIGNGK